MDALSRYALIAATVPLSTMVELLDPVTVTPPELVARSAPAAALKVTLTAAGDTGVYDTGEQATLNTISGHRDGYATLCPGAALYSALPEIRGAAGASVYGSRPEK